MVLCHHTAPCPGPHGLCYWAPLLRYHLKTMSDLGYTRIGRQQAADALLSCTALLLLVLHDTRNGLHGALPSMLVASAVLDQGTPAPRYWSKGLRGLTGWSIGGPTRGQHTAQNPAGTIAFRYNSRCISPMVCVVSGHGQQTQRTEACAIGQILRQGLSRCQKAASSLICCSVALMRQAGRKPSTARMCFRLEAQRPLHA